MKKCSGVLLGLVCAQVLPVSAEIEFYGKANVSYEFIEEAIEQEDGSFEDASYTDLLSNASRVGVKGSEELRPGLNAVYQLEYEVFFDNKDTFSQRNIFVGLEGAYGALITGHFDTPLKAAQGKVDLYNDLRGDIKRVITVNENRVSDIVMYTTPSLNGLSANIAHIAAGEDGEDPQEDYNGVSVSLQYKMDALYLAAAYDENVEAEDAEAFRFVGQADLGGLLIGALYEQYTPPVGDDVDGWLVSAAHELSEFWTLKAQYGQSDIQEEGGETLTVGADHALGEDTTLFAFYTKEEADGNVLDNQYLGLGLEVKF